MRPHNEKKKMPQWKKGLLIALCILLLLILVIGIFATVYINYLLSRMGRVEDGKESTLSSSQAEQIMLTDPELETIDPTSDETYISIEDITFPTQVTEPTQSTDPSTTQNPAADSGSSNSSSIQQTLPDVYGDHLVNILLVGQDRREGQTRQRSDSMILVTCNKSTGTITLTSFMRDQYVQIPGYKPNKLNAAYAYGGMSLLSRTLELNFGVKVDGVVEVDFNGFQSIIELLGGVDISLTDEEEQYLSAVTGSQLTVGTNRLNAEQALIYARLREIDSDYGRAQRQRNLIVAILNAYKSRPLTEIIGLLDDILPIVTTNMSNSKIISYATDLFPMLSGAKIDTMRIPISGTYSQGYVKVREGFAAWLQYNIDFYANKKALYEIFAPAE